MKLKLIRFLNILSLCQFEHFKDSLNRSQKLVLNHTALFQWQV